MVKNILVIKHGSFGDIIQINGCLKDIREHYSKHKIYILTTPAFNNCWQVAKPVTAPAVVPICVFTWFCEQPVSKNNINITLIIYQYL